MLGRVLAALARQTRKPDRTIIVDDGSSEDIGSVAARYGAECIRLARNSGFAVAVNRGIEAVDGGYVAIINNDVVPNDDWLEELARPAAEFATGKIVNEDDPTKIDGTFDLVSRAGLAWRAGHGRDASHPDWNTPREIQIAPLTAALFRRDVFARVGALDPNFGAYLEDVDLGLRCATAGIRGRYVPSAVATHKGSMTLGAWHPETVRLLSRNQMLLIAKHYPPSGVWKAGCNALVGQLLWAIMAARHGQCKAWWRGKQEGLRLFRHRMPAAGGALAVMEASERELLLLQERHGWDRLWRWYSWLT